MSVPVIDLFAGPGGLGEGFSRQSGADFRIAISIEKDAMAHETLRLRAAYRNLMRVVGPQSEAWQTWEDIVAQEPWNVVFHRLRDCGDERIRVACVSADHEAMNLEMGPGNRREVAQEIRKRLAPWSDAGRLPENSVLIGGPPCQAYSIVGRSRNRGIEGYRAESDHRHFLYLEYLSVIAEFQPAVFVMENVKGILTSKVGEGQIFWTILKDLRRPDVAAGKGKPVEYVLCPLPGTDSLLGEPQPEDFIVRAEHHGVPQARHRVIILGIRKDVHEALRKKAGDRLPWVPVLQRAQAPTVSEVISDLPELRPDASFRGRGLERRQLLDHPSFDEAVRELRRSRAPERVRIADLMMAVRNQLKTSPDIPGSGEDRVRRPGRSARLRADLQRWYSDRPSRMLANHSSRSHMPSDMVRYLFVSAFGEVTGESPHLVDFPPSLLPEHRNVDKEDVSSSIFKDRFRVQLGHRHSMTVTSHIAKDGHAFIHPEPGQFRSLTVREAARLQTFPDTYVFLGNRTSQYTQVGNAVPPMLAHQIAGIVAEVLNAAELA